MWVQVVGLVVQVVPAFILFCGGGGGVHWVQVVQGAGASGVLRCVFRPFVLPFVPLLLLLSCNTCKICPISRFKGDYLGL